MVDYKNLPQNVQMIISTLESAGYEAFVVGGCVRDMLRGVPPKDWDIATSATPLQAKALFSRTVDTGIKHGTITVLLGHTHYEVTTYRIDGEYLDNRRPESVIFSRNIEEDLSRRDFTMNAIAYNQRDGFIDPFNGRGDIKNGIIRCVGVAEHRFAEDALRMLRAVRFAAVTGFSVDGEILHASSKLRQNLKNISPERVREELGKLICAAHPQALELLDTTGLLPFVLQGREFGGHLRKIIAHFKICPVYEPMRLALFLSWAGDECENILRDLRFDNKTIKEVAQYIRFLPLPLPANRYEIKKLLGVFAQESLFENFFVIRAIEQPLQSVEIESIRTQGLNIIEKGECFTLKTLALNGKDLAQMGIAPGKTMGDMLTALLDIVMHDASMNTKSCLESVVYKMGSEPGSR